MAESWQNVPLTRVNSDFWSQPVYQASDGSHFAPGFSGDVYARSVWDKVRIPWPAGELKGAQPYTPGLCEVDTDKGRSVEKKKAIGQDGERQTIHGINSGEFKIKITIWTAEQWRHFKAMRKALLPPPVKSKTAANTVPAFQVEHPELTSAGITAAVFTKCTGPEPGKWPRSRTYTFSCNEWLAPSKNKATKTVVKAKGSTRDPATSPTPGSSATNTGPRR